MPLSWRMRQAPHIVEAANGGVVYGTFQLDLEPGVGLTSGQGSDPSFLLSWSNDGGKNFLAERVWSPLPGAICWLGWALRGCLKRGQDP